MLQKKTVSRGSNLTPADPLHPQEQGHTFPDLGDPETAALSEPGSRKYIHGDPRSSPQRRTAAVPTLPFHRAEPQGSAAT